MGWNSRLIVLVSVSKLDCIWILLFECLFQKGHFLMPKIAKWKKPLLKVEYGSKNTCNILNTNISFPSTFDLAGLVFCKLQNFVDHWLGVTSQMRKFEVDVQRFGAVPCLMTKQFNKFVFVFHFGRRISLKFSWFSFLEFNQDLYKMVWIFWCIQASHLGMSYE